MGHCPAWCKSSRALEYSVIWQSGRTPNLAAIRYPRVIQNPQPPFHGRKRLRFPLCMASSAAGVGVILRA
eukprot:7664182-Alexandrium_andersonii.AAC.1